MNSGLYALPPHGIMGMGPSAAYILPESLKDIQFSIVVALDRATQLRVAAGIHTTRNNPECEGRRPKTPERLGM